MVIILPALVGFTAPQEQVADKRKLFERTSQIVLATVSEAKLDAASGEVSYLFVADKVIKGDPIKTFNIVGDPLRYPEEAKTFQDHQDQKFWDGPDGRCSHHTDGKIYPSFAVGETYLIFLDKPYHNKSFELIQKLGDKPESRDKWLQWVESQIGAEQAVPPKSDRAGG